MLKAYKLRLGADDYFARLAREEYFTSGGEPPGLWHGRGAARFGLSGRVAKAALKRLFRGRGPRRPGSPGDAPTEDTSLVSNADSAGRVAAWDMLFAPPKSVSIAWAAASEELRRLIGLAHHESVTDSIDFLERLAASIRKGRGGVESLPAGFLAALFQHHTSRAADPFLHTHALLLNAGVTEDGQTGALDAKQFLRFIKAGGAYYRTALSHRLQRLGFKVEVDPREPEFFRLTGISEKACDHYSKRRKEVLEAQKESGDFSVEGGNEAARATRASKTHRALAELLPEIQEELRQKFGITSQVIRSLTENRAEERDATHAALLLESVAAELTERSNHFTLPQLLAATYQKAQLDCFHPAKLEKSVEAFLGNRGQIRRIAREDGGVSYTTAAVWAEEEKLLELIRGANQKKPKMPTRLAVVEALYKHQVLEKEKPLTDEQEAAVWLATGPNRVAAISGLSGVGKSSSLACVREVFENSGFRVIGASPTGKAERQLERSSQIPSRTLASLFWRLDHRRTPRFTPKLRTPLRGLWHVAEELLTPLGPAIEHLDAKTVLVVDEASMLSNQDLAELLAKTEATGCRLLLVGDPEQLPAVERGGGFAACIDLLPSTEIRRILRQREGWQRLGSKYLAIHEIEKALSLYDSQGRLRIGETVGEVIEELLWEWVESGGLELPEEHQVIAATRADVALLNDKLQAARRNAGLLGVLPTLTDAEARAKRNLELAGDPERRLRIEALLEERVGRTPTLYTGDRVLFRENWSTWAFEPSDWVREVVPTLRRQHRAEVRNGEQGRVVSILPGGDFLARLDSGPTVRVDPARHPVYQRGYAVTANASQGSGFKNTHVLLTPTLASREHLYTMGTRHIDTTTFYYANTYQTASAAVQQYAHTAQQQAHARQQEAARYQQMIQQMEQSRAQQLAHRIEYRQAW